MGDFYLNLSDSAKLASTAKHYLQGLGFVSGHNFFDPIRLAHNQGNYLSADLPQLPVLVLSFFFRFLGASDQTVALTGIIFGIICLWLLYRIGCQLFGVKVGLLAVILTAFNLSLVNYALNFTTEILFSLEILLFVNLAMSKHRLKVMFEVLIMGLMLLTRQQAFVFIFAVFLSWLYELWQSPRFARKMKVTMAIGFSVLLIGSWLQSKSNTNAFISPARLLGAIHLPTGEAQGRFLRGVPIPELTPKQIMVKISYNFYNFAIAPDRIAPTLLVWLFIVGFFLKMHSKIARQTYIFFCLQSFLFLLAAVVTLPNARYLHPLIPFIALGASYTLIAFMKLFNLKLRPAVTLVTLTLTLLPSLGHWFIDSRFRSKVYNLDRPPARRVIAARMAQHILPGKLVLTNLDAWAAWYSGMNTMWFPANPEQIKGLEDKIDYIFITNYQSEDQDFNLNSWQKFIDEPISIESSDLGRHFNLLIEFAIPATSIYENREIRGVVFYNAKK